MNYQQTIKTLATSLHNGGKKVQTLSYKTAKQVKARLVPSSKYLARKTAHHGKRAAHHTWKFSLFAHHHLATRPHKHLTAKYKWYSNWHSHPGHQRIHYGALGLYMLIIGIAVFSSYGAVRALSDLSDSFSFSTPSDYTADSGAEVTGGVARLKAQNYASDANTAALYHFDSSSGTTATDSSSNSNDATATGSPSWTTGNLNNATSLNGSSQYFSAPDTAANSLSYTNTIEGWIKFNSSFSSSSGQDQTIVDKGAYKLYYDRTNGKLTYELAKSGATNWTQRAGGASTNAWGTTNTTVNATATYSTTDVYTATSSGVYKHSGGTLTKIGGSGVNSSWGTGINAVSLHVSGTTLYAGTDTGAVWKCTITSSCTTWTNTNFATYCSGSGGVRSIYSQGGVIYAANGGCGEMFAYNGSSWSQVGGFATNGSWDGYNDYGFTVYNITGDGSNLIYVSMGHTTASYGSNVWRYNVSGTTWTKIGGGGLNSGWNTTYQKVQSLTYFGGNLYAGVDNGSSLSQIWRWNGSSWTKIGGTDISSWSGLFSPTGVSTMTNDGTNLYAGFSSSYSGANNETVWRWNGSAWTALSIGTLNPTSFTYANSTLYAGGGHGNSSQTYGGAVLQYSASTWSRAFSPAPSWDSGTYMSVTASTNHNGKQYVGLETNNRGSAAVWENNNGVWTQIAGPGMQSSAFLGSTVKSLMSYNGNLYAGILGATSGDAQVWRYNGSSWTQVGGTSLNSSWSGITGVYALTVHNGYLYAGVGGASGTGDGEAWQYNGSSWTQVGGDGLNSGWNGNVTSRVSSMVVYRGTLYAGLAGTFTSYGKIYSYNGSTWTEVAGDNVNSSWNSMNEVMSLAVYNGNLIAGTGYTFAANNTDRVWSYNGTSWTQIGGSGNNSSWANSTYAGIQSLAVYNGVLYAGTNGYNSTTGAIWTYSGSSWSQAAGGGTNSSWSSGIESVYSMGSYRGKLYAGTGWTAAADAQLWSVGDNNYVQSATASYGTNWTHVAATYDGSNLKLYIDGTLNATSSGEGTIPNTTSPLLIGASYGNSNAGNDAGYLSGKLDELRISDNARSSFVTLPYSTAAQAVTLNSAIRPTGVWHWDSLSDVTSGGGTVKYRLSSDGGTTWLYWNGSAWATSSSYSQSSLPATITTNMASFPVTFNGMKWQAILQGDGSQQVTLNSVADTATADFTSPSSNASAITATKANGGATLNAGAWTNGSSPSFSWTAGTDTQSGVKGYCAYLGTDNTADPVTTKGLLGTSPVTTGNNCQFIVSGNSLDTGTAGYLATALSTSNSSYYLRLKAIDNAGNIIGSAQQFSFKFDNTVPTNPGYITAPAGFVSTKQITLTWPTTGVGAASDANSGTVGLQYKINNSSWYGDSHSGTGDINDLLADDGSYTTADPPDYDNLNEGVNTVYFRTWDAAGNVTTTYATAAIRINTANAPSAPVGVTATPPTNTSNSFAFNWFSPSSFVGNENNLTYCYSINALPTIGNCTFAPTGVTNLAAGAYATQPDDNTFYVVARDESGQINYSNYGTVIFTANTPAPGIPLNVDVADVSIKPTSNWRLALTWDTPSNVGSGVSQYKVYRSANNVNFSLVGTSASTSFIDTGLSQQVYYYRVISCDSANKCGANSAVVSATPTGKFTAPAALVSDPAASEITTKKATIKWSTDRTSDSVIALGTKSGVYSPAQTAVSAQVTSHEVNLDNLSAGTTYYYVAKWTDEDGNIGQSQEMSFRTSPAPVLKEIETQQIVLSGGTVQFTSVGASKVSIFYGPTDAFGGVKNINTASSESTYNLSLDGLNDGTKYYYQLVAYDSEGNAYPGSIFSFTTPPRPRINNLQFQPLPGPPTSTQVVTWNTNVPANSTIVYGKVGTNGTQIVDPKMTTEHSITLSDLDDDSEYFLVAQSRDADGNLAVSDRQQFRTALDTRPPKIYDVEIETTIRGTGAQARGQVVISWKTDELATSQVAYATGTTNTIYNNKTAEDGAYSLEHIVIISDLPTSQVYSMQPLSKDRSGNQSFGEAQTAIVGRGSDDVLTIVLLTLQKVFGF